jgi:hypothetical protein
MILQVQRDLQEAVRELEAFLEGTHAGPPLSPEVEQVQLPEDDELDHAGLGFRYSTHAYCIHCSLEQQNSSNVL